MAPNGCQGEGQRHLQIEFLLGAFTGVWQGLEHFYPLCEVPDRFQISRALNRPLARSEPAGRGFPGQARLSIVMS
jgi:hypothetical protein